MKTLALETLEMTYNEQHNEIRLFVNSYGSEATLLTLNASNLEDLLEKISHPTQEIVLVAQPMKDQSIESRGSDESEESFAYNLSDDDLSEHFNGETYPVSFTVSTDERLMIESELWAYGSILDYVMS